MKITCFYLYAACKTGNQLYRDPLPVSVLWCDFKLAAFLPATAGAHYLTAKFDRLVIVLNEQTDIEKKQ